MDKAKKSPLPEKTGAPKPEQPKKADPDYVRGTIDPPTKKAR